MNTRHIAAMTVLLAAAVVPVASAVIINVPGDQPTIQAGINATVNGDEVVVAVGEYFESSINFNGKAITVRSTDPSDPVVVMQTIINAGGVGSVVTCVTGEGQNTVLSGFFITGGNADGGGMFNDGSSPTVTNCTFSGNTADFGGGGMYNVSGSSPTITNCSFSDNMADHSGGGMFNFESSPTVTDCTFTGNMAVSLGGGMINLGGSSPTVTNCTFTGNSTYAGGGMYNGQSSPTVTNCTFSGNTADGLGGGMSNTGGSTTVTNCSLCGNDPDDIFGSFIDGGGNNFVCPCPWDCAGDDDGIIGIVDFLILLGQWDGPGSCDFDGDGVGITDFLALLANWGPCP